jgi:hypothetical protein
MIREAIRVTCAAVVMVSLLTCGIAWIDDHPTALTWALRIGSIVLTVIAIVVFLIAHLQPDNAPDYLYQKCGSYFAAGGFAFQIQPRECEGRCQLVTYFQNQTDKPLVASVGLQPALGFFLNRATIPVISFEVPCEAGAYGMAAIPFAVPSKYQGKSQSFDVGVAVKHLAGRGKNLRNRDGIPVGTLKKTDLDSAMIHIAARTLLVGQISIDNPAQLTLKLPSNVSEELPLPALAEIQTLWKLGDPLLTETV